MLRPAGVLMLTVLPFTGVLTMNEALAGFADANVVLIATLFVIGEGLVRLPGSFHEGTLWQAPWTESQ